MLYSFATCAKRMIFMEETTSLYKQSWKKGKPKDSSTWLEFILQN